MGLEETAVNLANPVINGPYDPPGQHFELAHNGTPTGVLLPGRRASESLIAVPVRRRVARPRASRGR